MRATIVAIGSTGDVAPYLGVGQHLAERGHHVRVATHRSSGDWVTAAGLEFAVLPTEPREMMTEELAARLRRGGPRASRAVADAFAPAVETLAERIDALTDDCDVMLTSMLAWTGLCSADARGIPSLALHLQPLHPTREFAPFPLGVRSLGGPLNGLLGRSVHAAVFKPFLTLVDDIRARQGQPRRSARQHLDFLTTKVPTLHGFSPQVVPRPRDWRPGLEVVGSWAPPPRPEWAHAPDVADFIESGPAPVYIGFGSMRPAPDAQLARLLTDAVRSARVRAVVDSGWTDGLHFDSDDVLSVSGIDHRWLFPRVAAVVHHAGAGTTGAAVASGVPSVTVPVAHDQPFWARRLHDLGVAARPVPARKLSGASLSAAIVEAVTSHAMRSRAEALAARVSSDRGLESVAAAVDLVAS